MSATNPQPHMPVSNTASLLARAIGRFRRHVEQEAQEPVEQLDVNAALFLSDLCRFLHFSPGISRAVLGNQAANHVEEVLDTQVRLAPNPPHEE